MEKHHSVGEAKMEFDKRIVHRCRSDGRRLQRMKAIRIAKRRINSNLYSFHIR